MFQGAAQFIPQSGSPRRIQIGTTTPPSKWMSSDELREAPEPIGADASAVRRPGDIGKMSLPGAQAKTAFYWTDRTNRWGVPGGRTPTTHIIKPCIPGLMAWSRNEHLCQDIGSPARDACSAVVCADARRAVHSWSSATTDCPPSPGTPISTTHSSRGRVPGPGPDANQQVSGGWCGPGISQITNTHQARERRPEADVERFLKANMFNWLIGGPMRTRRTIHF